MFCPVFGPEPRRLLAPTLIELAAVMAPRGLHGRSLVPLFRKDLKSWRDAFLSEYFQEQPFPRIPTWQAVRTSRWKYIHYPDFQGMDELYDLKTDPYEMKNMINDPGSQATLKEMQGSLRRLMKESE